jgi:hypothetical protein
MITKPNDEEITETANLPSQNDNVFTVAIWNIQMCDLVNTDYNQVNPKLITKITIRLNNLQFLGDNVSIKTIVRVNLHTLKEKVWLSSTKFCDYRVGGWLLQIIPYQSTFHVQWSSYSTTTRHYFPSLFCSLSYWICPYRLPPKFSRFSHTFGTNCEK